MSMQWNLEPLLTIDSKRFVFYLIPLIGPQEAILFDLNFELIDLLN